MVLLIAGLALGGLAVAAGVARSQHHGPTGSAGHQPPAGQGHLMVQRCQAEFERVVGEGRGFGMAFVADQNGYPGPMHVLELRERLQLSTEQVRQMEALMGGMFAESKPKSARLLEAERRLGALFAGGRAGEAAIRLAVAEVEEAHREVRLVHLLTHLKTRDLLTDEQRRQYQAARWGQ